MAKIPAIYGDYLSNTLRSAVWTANVAVSTSYSLTTFSTLNPAARVVWGVTTVTITATIASALGDILIIPMHNLTPGSSTVLQITNGSGFSQFVTIPALQRNRFSPTLAVDLKALDANDAHRTTTAWNFVVTSNVANVIFGAAIAIYGPKTTFLNQMAGDNFAWEYHDREIHDEDETRNRYGSLYIVDYTTARRATDVVVRVNASGLTAMLDFYRGNHGSALPGFFWPDPNVPDARFGRWIGEFDVMHLTSAYKPIAFTFEELSKGKPIA